MLSTLGTIAATTSPPAAGAAIDQVVIATAGATVLSVAMLVLIVGHRSGRISWVGRIADFAGRVSGMPGWAALPGAILGVALLTAVFGMYWDISLHIDNGRDPGPLANPAHYFILLGLFGVFFSGVASIALPLKRPCASAVRLPNGWYAPVGGLLVTFCGAVSLLAFPLDDMWHRLFGQDVTLWGPTHLLLIGGASFSIVGQWILIQEGRAALRDEPGTAPPLVERMRDITIAGSLLIGLSTFQAEFDFAVPQFRLIFHPVLLMLAAGVALVAARVRLGPGGALGAVGFYIGLRALLALLVGPVLGQTTPHLPLYLAEAGLAELVALGVSTRRPVAYPVAAGLAIGTLGLAAEWGWSHVWGVMPWPSSLFPEVLLGVPAALAGAVMGGFIARSLKPKAVVARPPRWLTPAAAGVAVLLIAWGLPMPAPARAPAATLDLQTVHGGPKRTVAARVTLEPPNAATDARWLTITAWQGGGSVVDQLRQVGPGRYASTKPIPVYGDWKSTLRLQRGRSVLGLPIFMPNDPAIPAKGIPAATHVTRAFVQDHKLLQREQKKGVPGFLTVLAYLAVAAIWLSMLAALAWGLLRFARTREDRSAPPRRRPDRAPTVRTGQPAAAG